MIDKLLPLLFDSDRDVRVADSAALATVLPDERAGSIIDRLQPLLADSYGDVRVAAAKDLAAIPRGERAGNVIDKLLPRELTAAPSGRPGPDGGCGPWRLANRAWSNAMLVPKLHAPADEAMAQIMDARDGMTAASGPAQLLDDGKSDAITIAHAIATACRAYIRTQAQPGSQRTGDFPHAEPSSATPL